MPNPPQQRLIFQLGTNNWQSAQEFAPGSGILHEQHHNTFNARADVSEFQEAEGVHLRPADWEEDVDTFGGLVVMLIGRVPARGEVIAHPNGHEFEVTDADPRRIKRLRLTLRGAGNGTASTTREAAE